MRNTYDLFPIKYHHVHIRDHGDIFGQLIDSCSHLLSSSKDKWNCDTTTTFFDENDIIPPDELGQFLAPYLYQYFPPEVNINIVNSWVNVYDSGNWQEPHHHIQFPEFINFSGVIFINYDPEKDAKFYFENMNFTPTYWLPGSDSLGNLNGSVRVYGVWTATHTPTQKSINLKSYHYWDFNDDGLITQVGDYFDATGMMMSLSEE